MPPEGGSAAVARLLVRWQAGSGDYLDLRDQLFAGETVATLAEKIGRESRETRDERQSKRGQTGTASPLSANME